MKNIFCNSSDINSEADVESLVVERLLSKLRYPDNRILRKDALDKIKIGRGSKKEFYRPDYVLLNRKKQPTIVIDAKSPTENLNDYHYQVSGYSLALNQRFDGLNPVRFTGLTNGTKFLLYPWDSDKPILKLDFTDFEEDNAKFVQLRSMLSYGTLEEAPKKETAFEFKRPNLNVLVRTFIDCHNLIWKKEKLGPTDAFYEFAKLMFVKLRADHRVAKMLQEGKSPKPTDFNFSVSWITQQVENDVDENPVANILFRNIRDELEEKIRRGEKKRIFLKDESLNLSLGSITEVVKMLEHYDLHGIDEDLNGRMFETFLNATVRGAELGQFFTPRSIVKYMTRSARLVPSKTFIPKVLDGCCGSGGFLVEAMAEIVHGIDGLTHLTSTERGNLKRKLYADFLFGVDANERIARVARLNMYLHGDGGSKIFNADMLDKELQPGKGVPTERLTEMKELQKEIIEDKVRFDAILTNPPFSMKYKAKDPHEARILEQYQIAAGGGGQKAGSLKSNVLFLERYFDLLKENGHLLTVIDNTVLNGEDSQDFRDFIFKNFIVKQVIALPFNTFFRAQANVQTSIIHLVRKSDSSEQQGDVFMGILNNIGHDDHQRYTPERDNTPELLEAYLKWSETGKVRTVQKPNTSNDEALGCPFQIFSVPGSRLSRNRLDAFYYAPELMELRKALRRQEKKKHIRLLNGNDLQLVPRMTAEDESRAAGKLFKYFEIGDVTREGAIINSREDEFENLPTRGRLQVRTNDVIFAKNNSSRGTTVIVPRSFDGQLVTTGFIGIRPKGVEEALLLWSIFESEAFRKQIYYLAITAVQPEVREEIFRKEFLLPVPTKRSDRVRLIKHARRVHELHVETHQTLEITRKLADHIFEGR